MTRKIWIDTDTASDDVLALIMGLRDSRVHVEGISVVAGNLPIDTAVKNALISVERAGTYAPPVYRGAAKPLLRPLYTSEFVHGSDGMGEMNLPPPTLTEASGHAIDALIACVAQNPGQIELLTLGPLTNLALACAKAPDVMRQVKRVVMMGSAGLGPGNITPVAEFNMYVDAEAVQIVLDSGMPLCFVGWDVSTDETFINQRDIDSLLATGSERAAFCVRCNATLQQYNLDSWGKVGFDMPDPTAMAVLLEPDIATRQIRAYCAVEYRSEATYGQVMIDPFGLLKREPNADVCLAIDPARFKALMFRLIQ